MRELAKLANVSLSTVSKAFSDAEDISSETRKHIFKLAKKNGCYEKFYKGTYPKKIIGIICPELESSYYISFVMVLKRLIEANNCIPIISTDHFSTIAQAELIDYFDAQLKVDGIFVFELKNRLAREYNCPIISLIECVDNSVDSVSINFEAAISEAVKLLSNFGHKKIAFIGEPLTKPKALLFKKSMENNGIIDPYIIESKYRFERAGEDGIKQLLANKTDYTAIICAYDYIAFGAIKQLRKLGFHVPDDFSVVGIDNINTSQYMETPLSSIGTNSEELCMIAWDLMEKKLKNKFLRINQQIVITGNLIIRESIGKAKTQE